MDINDLRSLFTVLGLASFVGIVWWVYSGRRGAAFEQAARIPLDDDDRPSSGVAGHKNQTRIEQ